MIDHAARVCFTTRIVPLACSRPEGRRTLLVDGERSGFGADPYGLTGTGDTTAGLIGSAPSHALVNWLL